MNTVESPADEYNAADFATDAHKAAMEIASRRALPIVVGGTGFYLQWLVFGRPGAPAGGTSLLRKKIGVVVVVVARACFPASLSRQYGRAGGVSLGGVLECKQAGDQSQI